MPRHANGTQRNRRRRGLWTMRRSRCLLRGAAEEGSIALSYGRVTIASSPLHEMLHRQRMNSLVFVVARLDRSFDLFRLLNHALAARLRAAAPDHRLARPEPHPVPCGGTRMVLTRCAVAAALGSVLLAAPLSAQEGGTGTISGRILDSASQQPLVSATIRVIGTTLGALTRNDGTYTID